MATVNAEKLMGQIRGMSEIEAAAYIGISAQYLRMSRMDKYKEKMPGPAYCKIGSRVIYMKDDLDKWINSHRVESGTAK